MPPVMLGDFVAKHVPLWVTGLNWILLLIDCCTKHLDPTFLWVTYFGDGVRGWVLSKSAGVNWISLYFELAVSYKLVQFFDLYVFGSENKDKKINPSEMVQGWMDFNIIGQDPGKVRLVS